LYTRVVVSASYKLEYRAIYDMAALLCFKIPNHQFDAADDCDDNDNDADPELELELVKLRERLELTRSRRRRIAECRRAQSSSESQQALLQIRLQQLRLDRQAAVQDYQSILLQRQATSQFLSLASRWNVTNDAFHIWHVGPWATINGARLGSESPKLPVLILLEEEKKENDPGSAPPPPQPRRYLLWPSSPAADASASISAPQHHPQHQHQQQPQPPSEAPKVPWPEVNAALGHAVLLVKLLQERGNFQLTHELHPMASTSQIGIRRGGTTTTATAAAAPVVYNLYFEESSFHLFKGNGLRNFNIALQAFTQCIAEASRQQKDKTIAIPHAIMSRHYGTSNEEWKIGGLPIAYTEATAVDFTRACKYLLTDLKWLVAYAVKHVDR
jgi:hypothetical protein